MRHSLFEHAPLPLLQIGAHVENHISRRQPAEALQTHQHIRRQRARARADLEDRAALQPLEHLGALSREASAKQGGDLRSSGEIAARPEFARAGAVIAETGRIQCGLHVPVETDPAPRFPNLADQPLAHPGGMLEFLRAEDSPAHVRGRIERHGHRPVHAWRTIRYRSDAWRYATKSLRSRAKWSSSPEARGAWAPRSSE